MIFPCVTESENILPSSRSQERNLKSTGRKCVLSVILPPFTVVFIVTLKRKITWSQFWNKIWIFLFLFFSNMKPKRNDYFLCPIPWTEINIFKKSETFFPFFKPWTLCENAGARAGIENQLKHQVEQYWVWQQPSLFEKKMAEKCIEWISRKFMCYFRRKIHSCTKLFENCLL